MNSREPLPPPEITPGQYRYPVIVSHPALDKTLLSLPAFTYGVFCPLVLDACRVLTNHAGTGRGDFLASDIQGHNPIPIDDAPLTDNCYYFLGPPEVEANKDYPIVKTFSAFTFPPVLPDRWARAAAALQRQPRPPPIQWSPPSDQGESQMDVRVWVRDKGCIITRYPDTARCAYLVPAAEEPWFLGNNMHNYLDFSRFSSLIYDPANGIMLRSDVQQCFDDHGFVFYPDSRPAAAAAAADDSEPFVTYFVSARFCRFPDLFHRRRVAIHPSIPVELLYARFAYAIIGLGVPQDHLFGSIPEPPEIAVHRENLRRWHEEQAKRMRACDTEPLSDSDIGPGSDDGEYANWCVAPLVLQCSFQLS